MGMLFLRWLNTNNFWCTEDRTNALTLLLALFLALALFVAVAIALAIAIALAAFALTLILAIALSSEIDSKVIFMGHEIVKLS